MSKQAKPICFFITPIGKPDSSERRRADQIQHHILQGTLASKYKIVRADELPHPGSITHQIIELLYKADIVVADLTGSNANVAYELAIRHSFNKVSIHLVDKADMLPFDLKDERTVVFDLNDMDSVEECKNEIRKLVNIIIKGKAPYHSPVYRTLGLIASTSEDQKLFLNDISQQIDSIETDVSSIEATLLLSDLGDIETIKEAVEELEKGQRSMEKTLDEIRDQLLKISSKIK